MTVRHHPPDVLLTAFAAGTLDLGQHVAIATHLATCPRCRSWVRSMEAVGGAVLAALPASAMSSDALSRVVARLERPEPPVDRAAPPPLPALDDTTRLPAFIRGYRMKDWTWIAPRAHLRPIVLPEPSDTRVFLLRSGAGTKMLQHSHTGLEMTCVLSGAFSHEGGRYAAGDFDLGDESVDHQPMVDADGECICLVAMQGDLRLNGWLGRLMQPFVRL
jgi:putative transcriptional regulator